MECEIMFLQPCRDVKLPICPNKATVEVNARTEGTYKVCDECNVTYFSPKYWRHPLK